MFTSDRHTERHRDTDKDNIRNKTKELGMETRTRHVNKSAISQSATSENY